MNGIDLAPCPFCGSRRVAVYWQYRMSMAVRCEKKGCLAQGPVSADDVDAVKAWNNRKVKP